ncbi:sigma 54-interacting transcriptional regulator [Alteribacillus sp. HJP-4]
MKELIIQHRIHSTILDAIHEGMIAINKDGLIVLFNRKASNLTGISQELALDSRLERVLPESGLLRVLQRKKEEENQKLTFTNGNTIVTTRLPLWHRDKCIGALAVFKDVTDIEKIAEEVTSLKSIRQMLEAIINSSEEAISVVDEDGLGMMINPAYTRLTGLPAMEVIGKPAHTDISEGESMHMKVLNTKKPVRGVRLKVGPNKKDVLVNVAPVIVDGDIKGSVGVIHDVSEIRTLTEELKRAKQLIRTLEAKYSFDDIIGSSREMTLVKEQAERSANVPVTVLLRGESGTGKELFAHAIHNESNRKFHPFIRVNCAAIPETLLESELFGYEEGAFSGARHGGKKGFFEEADKGSILLDEIGEIPASTQVKLLRVLQEGEFIKVGGTRSCQVDVRVIAATNVNLEKALQENKFREDLYYRLNRMPIQIPPLRDRIEDIEPLCTHLITRINRDYGRNITAISKETIQVLHGYDWPGNVRELENLLGRAVISMSNTENVIQAAHLPELHNRYKKVSTAVSPRTEWGAEQFTLQQKLDSFEKKLIIEKLQENEFNKTKTADQLNISLRSLYYKMERHHIAKNGMQ